MKFDHDWWKLICGRGDSTVHKFKNGDGKLSMAECTSISRDKAKIEKDCKYWDANGDGTITEDEYVSQARRATMR